MIQFKNPLPLPFLPLLEMVCMSSVYNEQAAQWFFVVGNTPFCLSTHVVRSCKLAGILDLHEWYISACPWHLQLPCFSPSFSLYAFTTFTFNNALYVYDHSPLSPSWTPFWILSWLWCRRFKVLTRRPLSLRTTVTNKQHVRLKCITHYQTQEKNKI